MKFSETKVTTQLEILKRRLGGELFKEVALANSAFTNGICKAGNAIAKDGTIDTTGTNAAGILLNDVLDENPNGTVVAAFACVNLANCQENSGKAVPAAVQSALKNIVFE